MGVTYTTGSRGTSWSLSFCTVHVCILTAHFMVKHLEVSYIAEFGWWYLGALARIAEHAFL